jgi:membrane-associated progesterone receptor component
MGTTILLSSETPSAAIPQFSSPAEDFREFTDYVVPLISSPTNIALFIILCYVAYLRIRPGSEFPPSVISGEPIVFTYYTPHELSEFDGQKNKRILMGIRGRVYDVTVGAHFYGPGGPYGNFAGRDASRGLSKQSFDEGRIRIDCESVD